MTENIFSSTPVILLKQKKKKKPYGNIVHEKLYGRGIFFYKNIAHEKPYVSKNRSKIDPNSFKMVL